MFKANKLDDLGIREKHTTEVLIVGAGPTGLSLAIGLARLGISSRVFDMKKQTSKNSKAPVVHLRTREILAQWKLEEQFLEQGKLVTNLNFQDAVKNTEMFSIDFSDLKLEASSPGLLLLQQSKTEDLLLQALQETGLSRIHFEHEAVDIISDLQGITLKLKGPDEEIEVKGKYLVGCDGASSFVRKMLDQPFRGITYKVRTVLVDIKINTQQHELLWPRISNSKEGLTVAILIENKFWRIIRLEPGETAEEEKVASPEIRKWVHEVLRETNDFEIVWSSPFKIHRRSSPVFRKGRIILAGDAAHVHSPVGAQGMNAGIQDSHNLAWKLAAVLRGADENVFLGSYAKERKAVVVEKVSRYTNFFTRSFLEAPLFIREFSFFMLGNILGVSLLRNKFLKRVTMINLGYKGLDIFENETAASGLRMPNVLVKTPEDRVQRLYQMISYSAFVLEIGRTPPMSDKTNLQHIKVEESSPGDTLKRLKKLLKFKNGWILVRPDAHIAWAGVDEKQLVAATKNFNYSTVFSE